jgi:hypothetical protein
MSDLQSLRTLIANIAPGNVDSLVDIFSYQGFNPEMVIKHFLAIKQSKSIGDGTFADDLKALICLGVISGNYTNKNREKRDEKGVIMADNLFTKYDLHVGSIGDKKKAVTLPRVLLTFPILTSKISLLCPEKNYSGPFDSSSLPHYMKNAVFPSLVPKNTKPKTAQMFMIAFCCYSCDQSYAINPSFKSKSPKEIYDIQYPFVEISFNSPEPSASARKEYFKTFTIEPSHFLPVITKYKDLVNPGFEIPTPAQVGTE